MLPFDKAASKLKILPITPHHNVSKEQSGPEFISIPAKTAEHVMVQYNICFKYS